jgi:hypothetical protein
MGHNIESGALATKAEVYGNIAGACSLCGMALIGIMLAIWIDHQRDLPSYMEVRVYPIGYVPGCFGIACLWLIGGLLGLVLTLCNLEQIR